MIGGLSTALKGWCEEFYGQHSNNFAAEKLRNLCDEKIKMD